HRVSRELDRGGGAAVLAEKRMGGVGRTRGELVLPRVFEHRRRQGHALAAGARIGVEYEVDTACLITVRLRPATLAFGCGPRCFAATFGHHSPKIGGWLGMK